MKVIDIVKPEPRTQLEAFERWANWQQGIFLNAPWTGAKKIEVKQHGEITCQGEGRRICESKGVHSWFNHAQDKMQPSYPPAIYEDIY